MTERLGFEIFANEKASPAVNRAATALRKAAIDVEQAQVRVAKASATAERAVKEYGAGTLRAREATVRLSRAEFDAEQASRRLKAARNASTDALREETTAEVRAQRTSENTTRRVDSLKEGFTKASGAVLAVSGAAAILNRVLQQGLQIGLIKANAQVALGAAGFDRLSATAKTTAHSLGLTQSEFLGAAGQAAILARNLGFGQETAVSFGSQLPDLANRLSLMSNGTRDAAEMTEVLRSALAGEFDPLQSAGIAITANTVALKAASIQAKNNGKLSDSQATALSVLAIVTEQTARQTGVLATEQGKAAVKTQETTARLRDQWQQLEEMAAPAIVKGLDTYVKFEKTLAALTLARPSDYKATVTAIWDTNAAIAVGGRGMEVYNAAVTATTKAVKGATFTEADYTKALDANNNKLLILRGGESGYYASLQATTDALKENGRTVDVHTAKGRANRAALDQQSVAAADYLKQIRDQRSPAAFNKALDVMRDRLELSARKFGYTKAQAKAYANQILGIPHLAETKVTTPGLTQARRSLIGLKTDIQSINGRTVSITVRANGSVTSRVLNAAGRQIAATTKMASGGWVSGGTPGADSVPGLLMPGEFVVNARSARRHAGALESINRYAAGGFVNVKASAAIPPHYGALVNAGVTNTMRKMAEIGLGSVPVGGLGSGVARWSNVVLSALSMLNQSPSNLGITLKRMRQESGGNPLIVNRWDSNWRRGTPSVGLMQVIGPTFRAYAGRYSSTGPFLYGTSTNPMANVYASMRYALARYGSLPAAYGRSGGYDRGGLAVGAGAMLKGVSAPERVLSPRQTAAFERALAAGGIGNQILVLNIENRGVIGSNAQLESWLQRALTNLQRKRRI